MLRLLIRSLCSSTGSIITALIPVLYRVFGTPSTSATSKKNMTPVKEPDLMPVHQLIHFTRLKVGPGLMLELLTLAQATTKHHPELRELSELVRALTSKSPTPDIITTSPRGNKP